MTTARTQFSTAADILLKCFAAIPQEKPMTGAPHAPRLVERPHKNDDPIDPVEPPRPEAPPDE